MRFFKGSMIIEVIIGFGIAMVGLMAIMQMTSKSVDSSGVALRESNATHFVDEGMDWLKGQARASWSDLVLLAPDSPSVSTYCINELATWPPSAGVCGTSVILGTEFYRQVELSKYPDPTTAKLIVKASVIAGWWEGDRNDTVNRTYEFVAQ